MRKLVTLTAASLLLSTTLASAQTAEPTPTPTDTSGTTAPTTSTNDGAFAALSPGNQKIARALFEVQKAPAPTEPAPGGTTTGGTGTSTGGTGTSSTATTTTDSRWTLDQIAAAKQSGQGWGNIFKEMKAEGLVEAKNLGQVVSGKATPPSPPPPPPPSGDTSGTGGTAGTTTGSGTGSTTGNTTASGDTTTATSSAVAKRPSGPRHTMAGTRHAMGRDSEVTVTLGNNRDIVGSIGPRSSSRQGAGEHGGRSDSGVGARGIDTSGRHGGVVASGHASSAGTVRGNDGHGHGRGSGNGDGRGR